MSLVYDKYDKPEYCSQSFSPEEVQKGFVDDLLKYLTTFNLKSFNEESSRYFAEFCVTTDGYSTIVKWVFRPFEQAEESARFELLGEDEAIMKQVVFPDDSSSYVFPEDAEETFKEWLADNPGWEKDYYGHWAEKPRKVEETVKNSGSVGTSSGEVVDRNEDRAQFEPENSKNK